jgi:hypothetical protein
VESAFGSDVDYGMLVKYYSTVDSEIRLTGARPKAITGYSDPSHISTSYAERNNLSCRTFLRRLTRLTIAFSKKLENLVAMLWIYFAHYNFVRIRGSLRITPAMAANVTDHVWTYGGTLEYRRPWEHNNCMSFRILIPAASLRDPELSEVTTLRYEYVEDCDEVLCLRQAVEWPTPHFHVVVSGKRPDAGPRYFFLKL